jgi:MFS family permease
MLAYSYNVALMAGIVPAYFARTSAAFWRLFRLGVALFALGTVLLMATVTLQGMLSARILMGLGAGIFSPLIPSLISVTFEDRTRYLSYWATTTGAVCVFAPLLLFTASGPLGAQSPYALVLVLAVLSVLLSRRPQVAKHIAARVSVTAKARTCNWFGLSFVLAAVFVIYGQITWLIYSVPLRLAQGAVSDIELALIGTAPWVAFTLVCYLMRKMPDALFPHCLLFSGLLAAACIVAFLTLPSGSPLGYSTVMIGSGIAMAVANVPSTAIAFSYVDPSRMGLVSCLDILAARLGGAFYLYQFSWVVPEATILWSLGPLLLALAVVFAGSSAKRPA